MKTISYLLESGNLLAVQRRIFVFTSNRKYLIGSFLWSTFSYQVVKVLKWPWHADHEKLLNNNISTFLNMCETYDWKNSLTNTEGKTCQFPIKSKHHFHWLLTNPIGAKNNKDDFLGYFLLWKQIWFKILQFLTKNAWF